MRYTHLRPEFVEAMPEELTGGVLYISTRFRTAAHLCACGCGCRIVTPIKPAKWKFTYNGESVSLWPSIGNWQKPCRSHYLIRESEVQWATAWSDAEIAAGRAYDVAELREYYETRDAKKNLETKAGDGLLRRVLSRLAALLRIGN